jgi:hypothetical protein
MHLLWSVCSYLTAAATMQELPVSVGTALAAVVDALRLPPSREVDAGKSVRMLADDCAVVLGAGRGAVLSLLADTGRRHCSLLSSHASGQKRLPCEQTQIRVAKFDGQRGGMSVDAVGLSRRAQRTARHRDMRRNARVCKRRSGMVAAIRKLVFLSSLANELGAVVLDELKVALQLYIGEVYELRVQNIT